MTDGLPQRDPGATLPKHVDGSRQVQATVVVPHGESDDQLSLSFSRDEETMRRIAEQLRYWTGEPVAD